MKISLRLSTLVNDVERIWKRWTDDNGRLLAAGVAYYGALSFFPLLLTLISGVGLLLNFTSVEKNAETELLNAVGTQLSPALQVHVAVALDQVRSGAQTTGPIGLIALLIGAMAMFVTHHHSPPSHEQSCSESASSFPFPFCRQCRDAAAGLPNQCRRSGDNHESTRSRQKPPPALLLSRISPELPAP